MSPRNLDLIVKIGTLALSSSSGSPDIALIERLAGELASLKSAGHKVILVSSGAVGTGRALIKKQKPLRHCDDVAERQILASLGQAQLMALYQAALIKHGILVAQILLTKQDFRTRTHHKHMAHLLHALEHQPHILPIVNENDSVTVDELMFTDNDELAGLLASLINADRLIILSHIEGVYDRPPNMSGASVIPRIDIAAKKNLPSDVSGTSSGGRGGMQSKLGIARKMAALGIQTHIAAAREPDVLARLLKNESLGTVIDAFPGKRNAVKRWLASDISEAPASVTANPCLSDMIRNPAQALSLLPVGLTSIAGEFAKGDLVQINDERGKKIALGVARYDAKALRRVLGKKQQPVFIHYDQLHRVTDE